MHGTSSLKNTVIEARISHHRELMSQHLTNAKYLASSLASSSEISPETLTRSFLDTASEKLDPQVLFTSAVRRYPFYAIGSAFAIGLLSAVALKKRDSLPIARAIPSASGFSLFPEGDGARLVESIKKEGSGLAEELIKKFSDKVRLGALSLLDEQLKNLKWFPNETSRVNRSAVNSVPYAGASNDEAEF